MMRNALLPLLCVSLVPAAHAAIDPIMPIAHVVDGGFWKTTFKFANLGTLKVHLIVQFVKDGGANFTLPLLGNADVLAGNYSTLALDMAPGQSVTLETAGTAATTSSGWAV